MGFIKWVAITGAKIGAVMIVIFLLMCMGIYIIAALKRLWDTFI